MYQLDRPSRAAGWLDRTMPVWCCALLLALIVVVPLWYVARHYDRQHDFTSLIAFGRHFEPREVPEVRALHPAVETESGYDGQFYAQIALDPTLRRPDLKIACDCLAYRGQRWLPSALAWVLGLGQPRAILFVYALLNPLFWLGMIALMAAYFRGRTPRQYACLAVSALSSGALVSIDRSLSDLPGATLALGSALLDGVAAAVLLSLAGLCKPTMVVCAGRFLWPWPANRRDWLQRAGGLAVALSGPVVLYLYMRALFGPLPGMGSNLGWPVVSLIHWLGLKWNELARLRFHVQLTMVTGGNGSSPNFSRRFRWSSRPFTWRPGASRSRRSGGWAPVLRSCSFS